MITGLIYGRYFPKSKKWYVGQTIKTLQERVTQQNNVAKRQKKKNEPYTQTLFRALNKYNFETQDVVLKKDIPQLDLDKEEEYFIKKYNALSDGYNDIPSSLPVCRREDSATWNPNIDILTLKQDLLIYSSLYKIAEKHNTTIDTVKRRSHLLKVTFIDFHTWDNYDWSKEVVLIKNMIREGVPLRKISKYFYLSTNKFEELIQEYNIDISALKKTRQNLFEESFVKIDEEYDKIIGLICDGYSWNDIAVFLDVKISHLKEWKMQRHISIENVQRDFRHNLIREMLIDGRSLEDICEKIGITKSGLFGNLRKMQISYVGNGFYSLEFLKDNIVQDFNDGLSVDDIIEKYNISYVSVRKYLGDLYTTDYHPLDEYLSSLEEQISNGVLLRGLLKSLPIDISMGRLKYFLQQNNLPSKNQDILNNYLLKHKEKIIKEGRHKFLSEIVQDLNVTYDQLLGFVRRENIFVNKRQNEAGFLDGRIDEIKELYYAGLSYDKMARRLNTSKSTVYGFCKRNNFPPR